MTTRNLDALFQPASIALFGASKKSGTIAGVLTKNLLNGGYKGRIMLVSRDHKKISGSKCYRSLGKLPKTPELAIIVAPPASVPKLVSRLGRAGTKGVVIVTADFSEAEAWWDKKLQQQLLDAAKPHLLRFIGPNGLGIQIPGLGINASFAHLQAKPGKLAMVTQSKAMISSALDWLQPMDIGFTHVVSLGGMCDVDFGDMLNYLAMDNDTDAILLYLEAVTDARKFMSAARVAARTKPVIVFKAGRFEGGALAAASHTGALVGSDAVYNAAFRRTGILRVYSLEEMFDAVQTLSLLQAPADDRLAIITNGGGMGVTAADALIELGGSLAELSQQTIQNLDEVLPECWSRGNPVDILGDATGQRYADALQALVADDGIDAVLALNCPSALASSTEAAHAIINTKARHERPIFTSWIGGGTAKKARRQFALKHIPTYLSPKHAITAFMHTVSYRQGGELLIQTPPSIPEQFTPNTVAARELIDRALSEQRNWLTEPESKALLEAYEIPIVTTRTAHSPEEAGAIAADLGSSVVLKIISPEVSHKPHADYIALDLLGAAAVTTAAQAMIDRVTASMPNASITGFSVQPMVRRADAYELIIGMVTDPQFGPIILFGQGGTEVDVIDDKALGLPPLNMHLARELIEHTRIYKLLAGRRNRPAVNMDAIALSLIKVGQMIIDHPEIVKLDINPLLYDASGVLALDASIRIEPTDLPPSARLAIKPYPKELEEIIPLRDGSELLLRPIMPEDEPSLHESFAQLTAEEIYYRFFTPIKKLSHTMAARLTQLDYDREMALVLTEPGIPGKSPIYGVVRLAADPNRDRAEFAIIIGGIMTGKGLGTTMMQRIIDYARQAGIKELDGDVLKNNEPMLKLSKSLGFIQSDVPDDDSIVKVRLTL